MEKNGVNLSELGNEGMVVCQNSQGAEVAGSLVRLNRHLAVFEIYSPDVELRLSEALAGFKVTINQRQVYAGKAVVASMVNTGSAVVCQAALKEGWVDDSPFHVPQGRNGLDRQFNQFLSSWQSFYRVLPEFKAVIADMQTFLTDLRLWLDQVELELPPPTSPDRAQQESSVIAELANPIGRTINTFVDRFETLVAGLAEEEHPAHCVFLRRQLHPLLMSSPFAQRTFHKPLGYAGDYEMVNMMLRPPFEGKTLFAKIVNAWLLGQAPARAHRNRVAYLVRKLLEEGARTRLQNRPLRVLNVGCGPAMEVQTFLREHAASNDARFTLFDFNEETLAHVRGKLEEIKRRNQRHTSIQYVKRSVHTLLKESGRLGEVGAGSQYDYVYCAGLFDYLSDQVCRRLMALFYNLLAPGGLVLATNVSETLNESRPFRYSMEYMLDWHLIYRGGPDVAAFAPPQAPPDGVSVYSEDSGVNVLIEVRKPGRA